MKELINLYIADMSSSENTSGVDRYIESLIIGLSDYNDIAIHWIHLVKNKSCLFPKQESFANYLKYTIPLPEKSEGILSDSFWINKYNEEIYRLINHLFLNKSNCVFHFHTLNLIDLAILLKNRLSCKIVTHLHCIPWKNLYDYNKKKFNGLFIKEYGYVDGLKFYSPHITSEYELRSYRDTDSLICVTESGYTFVKKSLRKVLTSNVFVIPNGISDLKKEKLVRKNKSRKEHFDFLFVGVLNESKGLNFVLKSLEIVKAKGYNFTLHIAGLCSNKMKDFFLLEFPTLDLSFKGRISFDKLKELYTKCDVGIIGSLQEQSSYVALEMAMFGMPIITTSVDGLDEIFTEGVNALKVNLIFSTLYGLSVDYSDMSFKIIELIENEELRFSLGERARELYLEKHQLKFMIDKTVSVYNDVLFKKL